jgi:hypothetical protein
MESDVPNCPQCGSDWINKKGFDRGKRRFYCRVCGKQFIDPSQLTRNRPKIGIQQKRVFRPSVLYGISCMFKKFVSSEVLEGIPCFGCDQYSCRPEFCPKLDSWLLLKEVD